MLGKQCSSLNAFGYCGDHHFHYGCSLGNFRAPRQTPPCQAPHPFLGDRQESSLSLSTHIQMNTKPCLFNLQNVFQMCPRLSIATVLPSAQNAIFLPFFTFQNLTYPLRASLHATTFVKSSHPSADGLPSFPSQPCPADVRHPIHEHFLPLPAVALSFVRMDPLREVWLKKCVHYIKTHLINSS